MWLYVCTRVAFRNFLFGSVYNRKIVAFLGVFECAMFEGKICPVGGVAKSAKMCPVGTTKFVGEGSMPSSLDRANPSVTVAFYS